MSDSIERPTQPANRRHAEKMSSRNLLGDIRFTFLNVRESVAIALSSLWSRRLRSTLTLLGVIIGVATVITVVSIIEGLNHYVVGTLSTFGYDSFTITKFGIITNREEFLEAMRRKPITLEQMEALLRGCTLCREVGATVSGTARVKYGQDAIEDADLVGATSNVLNIGDYRLAEGRMFTESDEQHKRAVCVIGNEIREILFPHLDPINKKIRVGKQTCTVIGMMEKRGSFLGQNLDNFVIIPISLFQKSYGSGESIDIHVKAQGQEWMETTKDQTRFLFRAIREQETEEKDDFGIVTTNALIDTYRDFTGMAYLVMIGVASISLLVGGIVIMNIMLVSVTERIKEIGIRKAVGARKADIIRQFLAESATIAIVGGILGILAGAGVAKIVSRFSPLPSSIEVWAIIAGLMVSGGVGIGFGILPAVRAARMDPILALRQE